MERATKEITTEEIIVSPEQSVDEGKEEIRKVPSRLRQELHRLAAVWERVSVRSSVSGSDVVGSGLSRMYSAKFHALAEEHEQARPNKG
jgi:uncharacterized protein YukE